MILYNITYNIDHSVHDEWLDWMKNIHIPEAMQSGLFVENRLCRLIGDEDSGGVTYSVQYTCKSMEDFDRYENTFAPVLREQINRKYGDKFVAFRSLLEIID